MMIGLSLPSSKASVSWWPQGAIFAADFVNHRYMRDGVAIPPEQAYSFTRDSLGWAQDSTGRVREFGPNEPRRTDRGLLLEPARTRLSLAPAAIGSSSWGTEGSATHTVLPGEYPFDAPCRIESSGQIFSRRISTPVPLEAGQTVHIKARYRAGTSPNFGVYMRSIGGLQSILHGPVGALSVNSSGAGSWANTNNTALGQGTYEVVSDFTPVATDSFRLGLSPRSDVAGMYVDVLGAEVFSSGGGGQWLLGPSQNTFTTAPDAMSIAIPPGSHTVIMVLADGTQSTFAGQVSSWSPPPATIHPCERVILT